MVDLEASTGVPSNLDSSLIIFLNLCEYLEGLYHFLFSVLKLKLPSAASSLVISLNFLLAASYPPLPPALLISFYCSVVIVLLPFLVSTVTLLFFNCLFNLASV